MTASACWLRCAASTVGVGTARLFTVSAPSALPNLVACLPACSHTIWALLPCPSASPSIHLAHLPSAGPRLLRLVALLAFDAKRLASGLDALSSLGVYPRHLATAKSGTVQIPGQPAVRSPLQIKYELLAQLLDDTTLPMGLSYLGVLQAAPPAEEADASLGEQCASYAGGWWSGLRAWVGWHLVQIWHRGARGSCTCLCTLHVLSPQLLASAPVALHVCHHLTREAVTPKCTTCAGYLLEAVKSLYRISVPLGLDSSVGPTLLTMQDACRAVQQAAAKDVAMQRNTERVEVRSTTAQIEGSMASGLAEVQQQVGGLQQQIGGLHAELQRVAAAAEQLVAAQRDVAARRERALLEAEESMLNLQIDYLVRKRDHVTRLLEQVSGAPCAAHCGRAGEESSRHLVRPLTSDAFPALAPAAAGLAPRLALTLPAACCSACRASLGMSPRRRSRNSRSLTCRALTESK